VDEGAAGHLDVVELDAGDLNAVENVRRGPPEWPREGSPERAKVMPDTLM
jgi:hypothetical protein